jgi:hypothetical protein
MKNLNGIVLGALYGAVQLPSHMRVGRVVNSVMIWTVFADPPHFGLRLYLAGVP